MLGSKKRRGGKIQGGRVQLKITSTALVSKAITGERCGQAVEKYRVFRQKYHSLTRDLRTRMAQLIPIK